MKDIIISSILLVNKLILHLYYYIKTEYLPL